MSKTRIFLLIAWITGFASFKTQAADIVQQKNILSTDTIHIASKRFNHTQLAAIAIPDSIKKKKFISALLAMPFPLGFVGAHRVMLGSGPWVPVVYVATLGGCFGLLPLIDFCFIIFSKDITPYENNNHIFMWIKNE
jgi:TM2 domain-containing membrane protein YozV